MGRIFTLLLSFLLSFGVAEGQKTIELVNPSFEGIPHAGTSDGSGIQGWSDCGRIYFTKETPPDIHLGMDPKNTFIDPFFGVRKTSSEGFTFLGFVVRDNETYEAVSQRLRNQIQGGKCYSFSIDLSRSLDYLSPYNPRGDNSDSKKYITPTVLRIYGGSTPCGKRELLAESTPVKNTDWATYEFEFKLKQSHRYITLMAFYKTPILIPYNGNLLLDNASAIQLIPCPDEEVEEIIAEVPIVKENPVKEEPEEKPVENPVQKEVEEVVTYAPPVVKEKEEPKVVINKELNKKTLKEGQVIKINNLYFDADSIVVNPKSIPALEELAGFLKYYPEVKIEIGGHTNGRPPHAFCDSLSEARAKNVAQFLYEEGIPREQVNYKGYGKREPVASDKYAEGRRRNQRVEIKVLSVDS